MKFLNFHMTIMMSAYTANYRGKNTIGPRWPRILLKCKRLNVKNSRCGSLTIYIGSKKLNEAMFEFFLKCSPRIDIMPWRSKRKPQVLHRGGPVGLKRLQSSTPEVSVADEVNSVLRRFTTEYALSIDGAPGSVSSSLACLTVGLPWKSA